MVLLSQVSGFGIWQRKISKWVSGYGHDDDVECGGEEG